MSLIQARCSNEEVSARPRCLHHPPAPRSPQQPRVHHHTSLDPILLYGLRAVILSRWAGYDFGSAHVWVRALFHLLRAPHEAHYTYEHSMISQRQPAVCGPTMGIRGHCLPLCLLVQPSCHFRDPMRVGVGRDVQAAPHGCHRKLYGPAV